MLIEKFPEYLKGKALLIYLSFKNQRAFMDKTLTQLSIDYILNNDFNNSFQRILESCLISEKSGEIRTLFLDSIQSFYGECEDVNTLTVMEAIFANNLENFYITRKENSFQTSQILQIIDILCIMCYKTQKSINFRHLSQILSECINCFEIDKQALSNEFQTGVQNINQIKQTLMISKGAQNLMFQEQIRMKPFQQHALTRLIQLFVIKSQEVDFEKAVYVYNILLSALKTSANDRRQVICDEMLHNLKINTHKELCWLTMDNPIFIDICKRSSIETQPEDPS